MNFKEKLLFTFVVILLVFEFYLLKDVPAFWDAISKFRRASWFLDTNFSSFVVPTSINSGHPPLWLWSISCFWIIFGKSIWAARLLLLIVNVGVFHQLLNLSKSLFYKSVPLFAFLLIFVEPTLIGQTTILNNDMLLLFFTLLALNAILKRRALILAIALSGLLMTNLRGIYCFLGLGIGHIILNYRGLANLSKKFIASYLISLGIFAIFLCYQWFELGWIIITQNESFSTHRESASILRTFKNAIAFFKNYLDFGRIFYMLPLIFFLLSLKFSRKMRQLLSVESQILLIFLISFSAVFFLGMVPFSNPMGPRYFLIGYILALILFVNLIYELEWLSQIKRKILLFGSAIGLVTGHLWIYPSTISQGWDSSLAYLNYFSVENKMLSYLEDNKIPIQEIGTNIPLGARHVSQAAIDDRDMLIFSKLDLLSNDFILLSNIENTTDDITLLDVKSNWNPVKEYRSMGVYITLYKNPNEK
ncbi:hypothetical protein EAX61_06515 [Dokdonia sinensis]|uniref:Glycosyltransferase RgtA/B/C/D-like domain-containing protein n=1 Tax=Dokdonia sinensis TaxID=2479847 RepID=A0A3M0G604_9FLAO|nr:glycosyltransferase family 39 protein [Dokdonia sinensis]RMB60470.1 hypothetical protein EAX61_06515 [Dokdonia sinensis]